jgi:hypothetical protein
MKKFLSYSIAASLVVGSLIFTIPAITETIHTRSVSLNKTRTLTVARPLQTQLQQPQQWPRQLKARLQQPQ